jgi:hypothetical protein
VAAKKKTKRKVHKAVKPPDSFDAADMGRPKDTVDSLGDNWEAYITDAYMDGATDVQVRALITRWKGSCSTTLWTRWMKDEDAFSQTIKRGRLMAQAWWENHLRHQAMTNAGNQIATIFVMKNRWGDDYRDVKDVRGKVDHTHDHTHTAISELDRRTAELAGIGSDSSDKAPVSH